MVKLSLLLPGLAVVILTSGLIRAQEVRKPPSISTPAFPTVKYYARDEEVQLECKASGTPKPGYLWLYKGEVLKPVAGGTTTFDSRTGTLTIKDFSKQLEGEYYCKATVLFSDGSEAAAISPTITVLETRVGRFLPPAPGVVRNKKPVEYTSTFFDCLDQGEVVGSPTDISYNWYMTEDSREVQLDNGRLFITQEGALYFSYVLEKDATAGGDLAYLCGISSVSNQLIRMGNKNFLEVIKASGASGLSPQIIYNNDGLQALVGTSATLECVFSGYDPVPPPLAKITWEVDSRPITPTTNPDKFEISNQGRSLTIKTLEETDDKVYICEATNSLGKSGPISVSLNVTSAPIWVNGLADTTVSQGTDVEFFCEARSPSNEAPPNRPTWMINGSPTGPHTDFNKFVFSPDNKKLTINNVNKAKDIVCVQCFVSNSIGTVMGEGCLNVLLPIVVSVQPPDVQKITKGDTIKLTVAASTDPSIKSLNYEWIYGNETYSLPNTPPHVFYDSITKEAYINTSLLSQEEYDKIGGVYTRRVFHIFEDGVYVSTSVVLEDVVPEPVVASAGIDIWIIGLIIGIVFLIVVVILIIFVICRKQQEGDYNVDKKETGAGLDPEKELRDKGFNDLSRPDYDEYEYPDKKPRGDLEYDDVPIGGDDESLGEYGDEEDTHFNEDGSFIGIYQKKENQMKPQHSTESTI